MTSFRKAGRFAAAMFLIFAMAAVVTLASVYELKIKNRATETVPVTIHCECGFHMDLLVEPWSVNKNQVPSQVRSVIVNEVEVFSGESKLIRLETGSLVRVNFIGIDDVEISAN